MCSTNISNNMFPNSCFKHKQNSNTHMQKHTHTLHTQWPRGSTTSSWGGRGLRPINSSWAGRPPRPPRCPPRFLWSLQTLSAAGWSHKMWNRKSIGSTTSMNRGTRRHELLLTPKLGSTPPSQPLTSLSPPPRTHTFICPVLSLHHFHLADPSSTTAHKVPFCPLTPGSVVNGSS